MADITGAGITAPKVHVLSPGIMQFPGTGIYGSTGSGSGDGDSGNLKYKHSDGTWRPLGT